MTFLLGLLLFTWSSLSQTGPSIPLLTSPVVDEVGLLAPGEKQDLEALARKIHAGGGPQIAILMVPNLQGYPIEEFSIRVAEKWQLGEKKKGNGLLIVISRDDRKLRIEVGEGIEGEITDYDSRQYTNNILTPAFKAGRFHQGLRTLLEEVSGKFNLQTKRNFDERDFVDYKMRRMQGSAKYFYYMVAALFLGHIVFRRHRALRGVASGLGMSGVGYFMLSGIGPALLIFFIVGLLLGLVGVNNLLYAITSSSGGGRSYGGGFGGGSSGGGGWSGGGGGFSGGGSSGDW